MRPTGLIMATLLGMSSAAAAQGPVAGPRFASGPVVDTRAWTIIAIPVIPPVRSCGDYRIEFAVLFGILGAVAGAYSSPYSTADGGDDSSTGLLHVGIGAAAGAVVGFFGGKLLTEPEKTSNNLSSSHE